MAEPQDNNSGRNERGQFGKGNPGGPGGSRQRAEFRRAMAKAVTPEMAEALMRRMARKGLEGDPRAGEFVLNQMAGRPGEAPPEPQVLQVVIPELNTAAACATSTEEVLAALVKGKIDQKSAKLVLDGIKTRFQILQQTQKDQAQEGAVVEPRPVPPEVLRALFRNFTKTGDLPEDLHEARAVIDLVKAGCVLPQESGAEDAQVSQRTGYVHRPRAKDPAMDELLNEAAYGTGLVRLVARFLLQGFASGGEDVTSTLLTAFELPAFGSVGFMLTGFEERFARRPYKAVAARLFKRLDALRTSLPADHDEHRAWLDQVEAASVCSQFSGERPASDQVLDVVLAMGQLTALIDHRCGDDVSDVMPLFDAAGSATGTQRDRAVAQLQELAKSGRFSGAGSRRRTAS